GHLSIVIFSLLIGGMVAIISRNGGMAGVVKALSKYARTSRSAQFVTWLLGVAIFFDDYANTLIVGNTMRSVTDRFKISREKLAYIVDSTAAPVAAIAFITTWIGAELGYIDGGIVGLEDFPTELTPYAIFISSLKYSFYPILTLAFILILVYLNRDFGPMLLAEQRARRTGQVSSAATPDEDEPNMEDLNPVKGAPMKWQHAFYPVFVVILMTIFGLVGTGMEATYTELRAIGVDISHIGWGEIWNGMSSLFPEGESSFFRKVGRLIGSSDSYVALLWASLSGVILAIAITLWNKTMRVMDTMHTMVTGFKTMLPALIILTLAWSLAITTQELQTAVFLSSAVEGALNPYFLPPLVFVLSAAIAFSTGSSWSTMAILYPIAIPTTWVVCQSAGYGSEISLEILLNVISTVLAASVLGDHCSPISDTTILSSLASDCNHIDHVRTQLPYAVVVGTVSLIAGAVSTFLGGGWLISGILLLTSLAILYSVVKSIGRPVGLEGETA
ncbi:MAG: Na+/H+ antiporter NhaC family protein, partial [Saprospiraceae bacterium]|nr:Na+/H+ antiporter NhaC family protein [Saprospiraceae bacterium]